MRVLTLYQKSTRGRIPQTRAMCEARADGTWVTVGPVARRTTRDLSLPGSEIAWCLSIIWREGAKGTVPPVTTLVTLVTDGDGSTPALRACHVLMTRLTVPPGNRPAVTDLTMYQRSTTRRFCCCGEVRTAGAYLVVRLVDATLGPVLLWWLRTNKRAVSVCSHLPSLRGQILPAHAAHEHTESDPSDSGYNLLRGLSAGAVKNNPGLICRSEEIVCDT